MKRSDNINIKHRIKKLLKDFIYRFILGNKESRKQFINEYKSKFKKLQKKKNERKIKEQKSNFINSLISDLAKLKDGSKQPLIFLFSGTTYIQEKRGNRPIRLANIWLDKGIPVIFSYYRWNKYDDIPTTTINNLYQIPIDYTMDILDDIISMNFGKREKIFIVSFPYPELVRYVGKLKLNGWKIIYDVRDNWEEFHKVNMARWYDESAEKYFVANSDIVCCVAKPLQEKMQSYTNNKRVLLSPNALDKNFLENSNDKLITNNSITVGYIGHLSAAWFDWDSLIEIAKQKNEWTFEIVGHFEPRGVKLPTNVKLLGSKNHDEIKEITKSWNVAIIPFKIGKLSDCVDPIKVYEYLAMNLPVVSFRMPQIHDYPNVYIANNINEFIEKINKAVSTPFDFDAARKFLNNNTWDIRAQELLDWTKSVELLDDFLN